MTPKLPLLIVYDPLFTPLWAFQKSSTKDWQHSAKDLKNKFHIPRTARAQLAVNILTSGMLLIALGAIAPKAFETIYPLFNFIEILQAVLCLIDKSKNA